MFIMMFFNSQMSPIMWLFMFVVFICSFLTTKMMMYYQITLTSKKSMHETSMNQKNWKW